jgi:hypothetical protein
MSIVPKSATTCSMRFEIYRNKNATDEEFHDTWNFLKQVETEDKALSTNTHKNLVSDTYVAGPLHPVVEETLKFVEGLIRDYLKDHVEEEKKAGTQIWPVRRNVKDEKLSG